MKENLEVRIAIPDGVEVLLEGRLLKIKGPKGENKRNFAEPKISFAIEKKEIVLKAKKATKREKAKIYTFEAHITNMLNGVQNPFVYKLKICSGHFPMNASVSGKEVVIKNFFGEKVPRKIRITEGAAVKIDGDVILVESVDKENAGQTASDIELKMKITKRDRRVFQDGVYIFEKPE